MKIWIYITLILFFCNSILAQEFDWVVKRGGLYDDFCYTTATDKNNNVYITGNYTNMSTWYICYIDKFDPLGNLIWEKYWGGNVSPNQGTAFGTDIAFDNDGNVYILGHYGGYFDFDPGPDTYILTAVSGYEVFIEKLDSMGNFIWVKDFVGNNSNYEQSIEIDMYGNAYIVGYSAGDTDFDPDTGSYILNGPAVFDAYIAKLDPGGNFCWAAMYGASANYDTKANSVSVDSLGNVFVTGSYEGTVDFDLGTGVYNLTSVNGGAEGYLLKLDTDGNFYWVREFIGPAYEDIVTIKEDDLGNIYLAGRFYDIVDFDPGPGVYNQISINTNGDVFILKLDSSGNFIWVKHFEGIGVYCVEDMTVGDAYDIYITGTFNDTVCFINMNPVIQLVSGGNTDGYVVKLDALGNAIWAGQITGTDEVHCNSLDVDQLGNIYVSGNFMGTADFDPSVGGTGSMTSNPVGYFDAFLMKINQKGITGFVYNDINHNCVRDTNEFGIPYRYIYINPGNIIVQTNIRGIWNYCPTQSGFYSAEIDVPAPWANTCLSVQIIPVNDPDQTTLAADFALTSTQPCAHSDISIYMPFMRRCFDNQYIYIHACNRLISTGVLPYAYVDISLDSLITLLSSSIPYTDMGNNIYRFQLNDLYPGQCTDFIVNCHVSCSAIDGQTLCINARVFPVDTCMLDTTINPYLGNVSQCTMPWDNSNLTIIGSCLNDTVVFIINNTGNPTNGNMNCWSPVRLYLDGNIYFLDSVKLDGGDSKIFQYALNGYTCRMEVDQHPLHPGNSHPSATVELCGDISNWTQGMISILPQDDEDPNIDIFCGEVTTSHDPNDKVGYPIGVSADYYILPNQPIQYVVNFQNTGSDTAFTVVIRDTLDLNLDIFSLTPGVASHNYTFQMYGPRVLEWTFNNILLPDSNNNEAESHGFITYSVNQKPNLPNGTVIYNDADIYFDYNAPVITNQVWHTINDQINMGVIEYKPPVAGTIGDLIIFPNPAQNEINIDVISADYGNLEFTFYNLYGQKIIKGELYTGSNTVSTDNLINGIYILTIKMDNEELKYKIIISE